MEFNFKQELINSFLAISRGLGAGVGVDVVFGSLVFGLSRNPAEETRLFKYAMLGYGLLIILGLFALSGPVSCATFGEEQYPLARLVATLTPEQLVEFNDRVAALPSQGNSLVGSILLAVVINVTFLAVVYYAPTIWNTAVEMTQALGRGFDNIMRGVGPGVRDIALANIERARQDPVLEQQMIQIVQDMIQTGTNVAPLA